MRSQQLVPVTSEVDALLLSSGNTHRAVKLRQAAPERCDSDEKVVGHITL